MRSMTVDVTGTAGGDFYQRVTHPRVLVAHGERRPLARSSLDPGVDVPTVGTHVCRSGHMIHPAGQANGGWDAVAETEAVDSERCPDLVLMRVRP
jgi:hypothetical protein